jgi:hypothetical protein
MDSTAKPGVLHYRHRWREPLSQKRRSPALGGSSNRATNFEISNSHLYATAETAAQLDREADLLLSVGRRAAAERLSNQAADLRQAVAS